MNTEALARVWSWDGRVWTAQTDRGPVVRVVGGAAFDVRREQLVLFGGARPGGGLDDMWAWDGASWRRQPDAGVGPRDHHVMAYDAKRDKVVLFGGSGARPPGADRRLSPTDTWEWDGARWTQVATTGPSSRGRSAMVYDEKRGEMVLFGGGGDEVLGDTWLWNGQRWRMASATGPAPRYAHAMAYDTDRGVVVLYGGGTFRPVHLHRHVGVERREVDGDRDAVTQSWHPLLTGTGVRPTSPPDGAVPEASRSVTTATRNTSSTPGNGTAGSGRTSGSGKVAG